MEIISTADSGLMLGAIHQCLLEIAWPDTDWIALVHGAAVAIGQHGIGLPAASGRGKSTLAAGLLAHGLDYLSDDLLAVAAPEGAILPWPMPLSVKRGSWPALAPLLPELALSPPHRIRGIEARLLRPGAASWHRARVPLRLLVSPCHAAGEEAQLKPIRPLEMLARLLADRVWIGHPLDPGRVRRFLDWLAATPSCELRYTSFGDAASLLRERLAVPDQPGCDGARGCTHI